MDNIDDVYNDMIIEYGINPPHKEKLASCDFCELGHNPNCGDEIELELKLDGDKIEDMAFTGHGCAISQSSTAIMIDVLKGKTIEEAMENLKEALELYMQDEKPVQPKEIFITTLEVAV